MITLTNVSLNFSGTNLFSNVNLIFSPGNCYGVIGANGAGKSTFLKILSGELECTTGDVSIPSSLRMSVLKQDHYAYNDFTVLDTIIMGNSRLYEIMKQKDELYSKPDFSDEDGLLVAELEGEFAQMNGWDAESDAGKLAQGLGLSLTLMDKTVASCTDAEKVKILLAQALFGHPEILLLDEPTNHLDLDAVTWLEEFLLDYPGTVIVVSHDRYFLNNVCTHIVDIDYAQIKMYVGNYEFWYESSQLIRRIQTDQNKKNEEKVKELKAFIQRFSANKSKSRQATSRKKLIDKLTIEELPSSSRRYPFAGFTLSREPGKEILSVENLSKTIDGVQVLNNVSFRVNRGDKIVFLGDNEVAATTLFKILMEELQPDQGSFKWGVSIQTSYYPKDNSAFFDNCDLSLIKWLEQYSKDTTETYLRGFLGRMLFSGEDVYKPVQVLSGGERVRCMLSRMMLAEANVLMVDQPTNHLDLESITAVNNGLINFKGIVLFSSHDREFVQTLANRVIQFTQGGIVHWMGTFDEYLEAQNKTN